MFKIIDVMILILLFAYLKILFVRSDSVSLDPDINSSMDNSDSEILNSDCLSFNNADISNLKIRINDAALTIENLDSMWTVPDCIFYVFPDIEALRLKNCNIFAVESWHFEKAANLKRLFLPKNKISVLPGGVFANMPKLQKLVVKGNEIKKLYSDSFEGLSHLTRLRLNNNQIIVLPEDIFKSLVSLRYIDLNDNFIEILFDDTFRHNPELNTIQIARNRLKHIDQMVFAHLDLAILDLPGNYFMELYYPETSATILLNLQHGKLERCYIYGNVTFLLADENNLSELYIETPHRLDKVSLNHNRLTSIRNLSNANNLRFLNLLDNPIKYFDNQTFANMTNLEMLTLPPTDARWIHVEVFDNLNYLRDLEIDLNGIPESNQMELKFLMNSFRCKFYKQMINGGIASYKDDYFRNHCVSMKN